MTSIEATEMLNLHNAIAARNWYTVSQIVGRYCDEPTTDEHGADELQDWLSHGDYSGNETPESIAAEWDQLCRDTQDL